jgi:hypothetical protein
MNCLVKIAYPDATTATFSYDLLVCELVQSNSAAVVEKSYDVAVNLVSEKFVNQNKS